MQDILKLMLRLTALKRTTRTGWNMSPRSVREAESVADHSWSAAMFAFAVAHHLGLDALKMVTMALVHDIMEHVTGDIVTAHLYGEERAKAEAEKEALEDAAMREIFLPLGNFGQQCYGLWREYEEQSSEEARVFKQLDKLEACIQAFAYREEGNDVRPKEFFDHAAPHLTGDFAAMLTVLRKEAGEC